jgi:hypothetical protein
VSLALANPAQSRIQVVAWRLGKSNWAAAPSLQRVLDVLGADRAEEHYLYLCSQEEKVPSHGMDLAIKG